MLPRLDLKGKGFGTRCAGQNISHKLRQQDLEYGCLGRGLVLLIVRLSTAFCICLPECSFRLLLGGICACRPLSIAGKIVPHGGVFAKGDFIACHGTFVRHVYEVILFQLGPRSSIWSGA